LICSLQERRRNCQSEALGGLEVDHQLEPRGLSYRKLAGLGPREQFVNAARSIAKLVQDVRAADVRVTF
jgi:hypothetical protein